MDYSKFVSEGVKSLKPSGIRKYFENAEGVISLGVGEPDFATPKAISEAAVQSIFNEETYYTSNWGLESLREAINDYLNKRFDLSYNPENEILVTTGTSEALDLALRTLVNPGDEVLIPKPSYVAYEPEVILAGGKPVLVDLTAENKFKLRKEDILKHLTDKTKVLLMPYPMNSTGAIMTAEEMMEISEVVKEHDLFVISDELYGELTYNGKKHVSFASLPNMRERTLVINGVSKAFAMTGWRLGYICGPSEVMTQLVKIHQFTMLCAPIMTQVAAEHALRFGIPAMEEMVKIYDKRRRFIVDRFNEIGLTCFEPEGAFYAFPCVESTGLDGEQFADRLLAEEEVAVVPGIAFGENGKYFLRICYAYSIEEIEEALIRIERFVKKLQEQS